MKQINQKLRETNVQFRALSSLNQTEYEQLVAVFDELVTKKMMHYTLKGRRRATKCLTEPRNSSLPGCQAKLDFILLYLKHNPNQAYHSCLFDMSQAKVSEWIRFLSSVL